MELKNCLSTVAVIQYITSTPHQGGILLKGVFETPQPDFLTADSEYHARRKVASRF